MASITTEELVSVLLRIGGTVVGSRNLGLENSSSDYDIAFTDEAEYEVALKFIKKYRDDVNSAVDHRYKCHALDRSKGLDIFLTDKILSNAEQLELWMSKH